MGRMLLGYGELEFWFTNLLCIKFNNASQGFRVLFRVRSESQRIKIGDAIIRPDMEKAGLGDVYAEAYGAMRHCLSIRNQYAHCHFKDVDGILKFTNLEDFVKGPNGNTVTFRSIIPPTLIEQDEFFGYTSDLLVHLSAELERALGRENPRSYPRPPRRQPPSLNSRPSPPPDDKTA
jgi:hypothetical protein